MRQSHPGLSISLFWPTSSVKPVPKTTKTACAAPEVAPPTRSSLTPNLDSRPTLWSWDKAGLPDNAHPDVGHGQDLSSDPEDPPNHEQVGMKPDLTVCENVGFEMRDDVPGLAFSQKNSMPYSKYEKH